MLKKRTLLRTQRKKAFQILRAADLEPSDFDWSREQVDGTTVSRLSYRQRDYYFQFSSYEMGARSVACPGCYQLVELDYPKGWSEQETQFRNWAQHLRREIECLDPWSELAKYRIPITWAVGADGTNETISGAEARAIAQNLAALADAIEVDFGMSEEQAAFVRGRLAYLAEAAMREKSRDWAYSALGVCATLAMALSLDEDGAAKLWLQIKESVGAFVRLSEHEAPHSVAGPSE
jgi:hypothetical protein